MTVWHLSCSRTFAAWQQLKVPPTDCISLNPDHVIIWLESSWGADADTPWTSALALCYSVGECCAPVWCHSAHTGLVNAQLNSTMRLISGTLRPIAFLWLPVLANIEPPALRRKAATDRLVAKACAQESWPLHHDISNPPLFHLTSQKPLWRESEPVDINIQWRESWKSASVVNAHLVDDPTIQQPGFALPRQQWSLLNHFCTGQGHCGACKKKWKLSDSDQLLHVDTCNSAWGLNTPSNNSPDTYLPATLCHSQWSFTADGLLVIFVILFLLTLLN